LDSGIVDDVLVGPRLDKALVVRSFGRRVWSTSIFAQRRRLALVNQRIRMELGGWYNAQISSIYYFGSIQYLEGEVEGASKDLVGWERAEFAK
jgi:hypothetical protein